MSSNVITLNNKEIQLIKVGINNRLTKRQQALLLLMSKCIKENIVFDWDVMIDFYYKEVNKYNKDHHWNGVKWEYKDRDIKEIYLENTHLWVYTVRPKIRNWFITNMGSMILKGSILALPVIELE